MQINKIQTEEEEMAICTIEKFLYIWNKYILENLDEMDKFLEKHWKYTMPQLAEEKTETLYRPKCTKRNCKGNQAHHSQNPGVSQVSSNKLSRNSLFLSYTSFSRE